LLALIRQGNEQALEVLYHRYYAPLCIKAYKRIPSTPLVEELVQDVFVNLWMKSASLDDRGNVKAYLYATLRNKILHQLRTEHTRSMYAEKIAQLINQQGDNQGLESIYARETEKQINQVISTLSPQCREAFRLSRFEHLSYKEIAEKLHISVNTVEKHVSKALRILREKITEYGNIACILLFLFYFFLLA
jgi:RNA polymerase sigma-70 factor (ECF subfamily)